MDYLPIFLDVRDRLVVVVGGGVVAHRKCEQLLKAHARVRVVAPELCADLAVFRDLGRIEHRPVPFSAPQLEGALLVVAATDAEAVNQQVAAAARERGLLVNVVDDGPRSSFIFPAIVDRSPVVVAVGTSGTSPTLARRVRTQIEALLPGRLGQLADYAGRWREAVRRALPGLSARLRFWDGFFNGPVARNLLAGDTAGADQAMRASLEAAREASARPPGEVYLIGVGPGDPDLLTLRAQQLLQQADVLLHDRLVPEAILERARRDAVKINVGKTPGRHEHTQEYINGLLLEHARAGRRVARVKGGDPFVFGRGGEELAVLREAGIPVVVVPGITAALGAAASAGLPLTHRGLSQAVTFVTATGAHAIHLDWKSLSQPHHTLVFYMGGARADYIAGQLLANGLPPSTPVALLERATWPDERVLTTTVAALPAFVAEARPRSPTLMVVGEVAALAQVKDLAGEMAEASRDTGNIA
jgi:uroporphyrin-III C-methyltransferase/precorrin-2 dehydrogenase/sirohydrochlorin ferrochelatase|nr:MAG: uroporphyrinogen-III C-methyltransferase [Pseudomonadota bacterium]